MTTSARHVDITSAAQMFSSLHAICLFSLSHLQGTGCDTLQSITVACFNRTCHSFSSPYPYICLANLTLTPFLVSRRDISQHLTLTISLGCIPDTPGTLQQDCNSSPCVFFLCQVTPSVIVMLTVSILGALMDTAARTTSDLQMSLSARPFAGLTMLRFRSLMTCHHPHGGLSHHGPASALSQQRLHLLKQTPTHPPFSGTTLI